LKSKDRYTSGKKYIYRARYTELLKNPLWQKKRLEIFSRDNFTCQCCGDSSAKLNVHHLKYSAEFPWESSNDELITFCEECHEIWYDLIQSGKYDLFKLIEVVKYYIRYEQSEIDKSFK
jgi:5-methylcytosine-specific restriction endonuclease McrA